jgi:hypothetical protein
MRRFFLELMGGIIAAPVVFCTPASQTPVDASKPAFVDAAAVDIKPLPIDAASSSDASPVDAAANEQTACDVMKAVGCQEGKIKTCARLIKLVNADFPQLGHFDVACISKATSIAEVKACGAQCTP